jgi:hypothetical protein
MKKDSMQRMGFDQEIERMEQGLCPFCGVRISEVSFRDEISKKEALISGLCQKCQDEIFKE